MSAVPETRFNIKEFALPYAGVIQSRTRNSVTTMSNPFVSEPNTGCIKSEHLQTKLAFLKGFVERIQVWDLYA